MTDQQKFEELKLLAESIGLEVRSEMGDFDGGMCIVNEQRLILINRRHPINRRVHVMARALHQAGLEDVFVKPAVREVIDEELAIALANQG